MANIVNAKKSGVITIVGKPNVGKSTLLNTICNKKVSIVSYKPQTTRNQIKTLFSNEMLDITFVDTPGFHFAKNKLDLFLNSEIKKTFKSCDLVLFLVDPTRPVDDEDLEIIKFIKSYKLEKIILVITKCDVVTEGSIKNHINSITKHFTPIAISKVSSKNKSFELLFKVIYENLIGCEQLEEVHDSDNFNIAEIIREQILLNCKKEVPYATGIYIEKTSFDESKNIFNIFANIFVEKSSQKPILIGKNGSMIKKIGVNARKELLKIYDCKINLKLFVKVQTD
ncbi:MAG: GTPase Era [Mycoplasmoidaceae bacterium]|nr:GTPase Era [Mycoplasmoidaceae bacterium]